MFAFRWLSLAQNRRNGTIEKKGEGIEPINASTRFPAGLP
jgi:hypothetical protein